MSAVLAESGIDYALSIHLDDNSNIWERVDQLVNQVKTDYYTVFNAGYVCVDNFNTKLNSVLNDQVRNFIYFKGFNDFDGKTFLLKVSRDLYYNQGDLLSNKIEKLIKDKNEKERYRLIVEDLY